MSQERSPVVSTRTNEYIVLHSIMANQNIGISIKRPLFDSANISLHFYTILTVNPRAPSPKNGLKRGLTIENVD